ncbi:kinase-like protein [Thelephora ganbajun]|uniref:Kinase-like protein n=1 Tax=Thelephora ganbajun TaxID=370292 RepID=A0ACB6ZED5_THEGA|nr:kinase-like protein [Thelephora ganbajun]
MVHDFRESWGEVLTFVDEAIQSLAQISLSPGGREFLNGLERGEAGLCIELMDRGLAKDSLDQTTRQSFLIVLIELAKHRRRLPDSIMITEKTMAAEKAHTSGGLWEVRRGTSNNSAIAIKTPKFTTTKDVEKIRDQFCREVILWNSLSHPNVLKLAGVLGSIDTFNFSTVSEWMTHETIMKYTETNKANRLGLLHGVAQGLKYMHDSNLVHGNIRATNILIANESPPRACLSGFGFISVPEEEHPASEAPDTSQGVKWRYLAPELIHPSRFGLKFVKSSKEADVYAFGLLVLEVLSGKVPFHGTKGVHLVCSIVNGTRPTKPKNATMIDLSDPMWELLQACWDGDRLQRPRMQHVEVQIGNAAVRWESSMTAVPFPRRPGVSPSSLLMGSSNPSSTGTRSSNASDPPRLDIPDIRVNVVGPEENNSDGMQEFYPTPSPISPRQPEGHTNETIINRLDGVGP